MKEIEVPKNLRQFMLEGAEETNLGDKKGARKQFRYGNLHIREYDDKFTVHSDKIDPRKNPLGHLLIDAPEVLIGLAGAAIGGLAIGAYIYKMKKDSPVKPKTKDNEIGSIKLNYRQNLIYPVTINSQSSSQRGIPNK